MFLVRLKKPLCSTKMEDQKLTKITLKRSIITESNKTRKKNILCHFKCIKSHDHPINSENLKIKKHNHKNINHGNGFCVFFKVLA